MKAGPPVEEVATTAAHGSAETAPASDEKTAIQAYDVATLRNPISVADMGRDGSALFGYFGTDLSRRGNLALIEDELLIYASGNAIVFEGVGRKDFLLCVDDGGIGCVVVHPSRKLFAVGGKGYQPNIYIYSYPEKEILRVLKGGAEKGYASLSFNKNGDKLASVSTSPDFMLTVWDWEEERVALHSKAFGQDVFQVRFSLDDERRLTTCGTGHIRFWKLAATFTGLKLQGSIGKFGKVELSDIAAFVEFPDGKVVSGTETGSLLLWEGNFIKCRFVRDGGQPCHEGEITYIELDRADRRICTAGADGYVRWWQFDTIDTAEVDADVSLDFVITPMAEYFIGEGKGVKMMVDTGMVRDTDNPLKVPNSPLIRSLYIVDSMGGTRMVTFGLGAAAPPGGISAVAAALSPQRGAKSTKSDTGAGAQGTVGEGSGGALPPTTVTLSEFHAGEITGMDSSPLEHIAVTGGRDGTVRVWDYPQRTCLFTRQFSSAVTALRWVPTNVDPTGRSVAVGFADGIVRVLRLTEVTAGGGYLLFRRNMVFKPHNAAVLDIAFSHMSRLLATTGADGLVFVFDTRATLGAGNSWTPLKFVKMGPVGDAQGRALPVNMGSGLVVCDRLSWKPSNHSVDGVDDPVSDVDSVLCSCNDGVVRELFVQDLVMPVESLRLTLEQASYQTTLPLAERIVRVAVPLTATPSVPALLSSSKGQLTAMVESETDPVAANKTTNQYLSAKTTLAVYDENAAYDGMIVGLAQGGKMQLARCPKIDDVVEAELAVGVYAGDGKEYAKTPQTTAIRASHSRHFVVVGAADGSVTVRPSQYPRVFVRFVGHNGSCGGVSVVTASFDDNYILSGGYDGLFSVHRIRRDLTDTLAKSLQFDLEAEIFTKATKDYKLAKDVAEPAYMTLVFNQDYRNDWQGFAHTEATLITLPIDHQRGVEEPEPEQTSLAPEAAVVEEVVPEPEPELAAVAVAVAEVVTDAAVGGSGPPSEGVEKPAEGVGVGVGVGAVVVGGFKGKQAEVEAKEIPEGAYSIEDAKKKSEEDAKRIAAEEMKEKVRHQIAQLQLAYNDARAMNQALPAEVRLDFQAMAVDGAYLGVLKGEGEAKLDEVHKECLFEAEKAETLRRKITNRLMDGMLVMEIPLYGFDTTTLAVVDRPSSSSMVQSLRCQGLHPSVKLILDDLRVELVTEELARAKAKARDAKSESAAVEKKAKEVSEGAVPAVMVVAETASMTVVQGQPTLKDDKHAHAHTHAHGMPRREMRKLRMDELSKHLSKKPSENDDDPRDLAAIKIAEKTVGDYKLKVADDYEVSEENRVNATKKRGQMALLEESTVTMRLQYNERFLSLRELKRQIIFSIKRDNGRIRDIDEELTQPQLSVDLWEPSLDPREFCDDFEEVTSRELDAFKAIRSTTPWHKAKPLAHTIITGEKTKVIKNDQPTNGYQMMYDCEQKDLFKGKDLTTAENFLADPTVMAIVPPRSDELKFYEVQAAVLSTFAYSTGKTRDESKSLTELDERIPVLRLARSAMRLKTREMEGALPLTDKQYAKAQDRRHLLLFERAMLMKKTDNNVNGFQEALEQLRVDRHQVLADLKLAELKMLCLFQEFKLLQTFESKDLALQQRQKRCEGEKNEIAANMSDQKAKLDVRMDDMKGWIEKLGAIHTDLKIALPDSNPFSEILNKIYKKKIKRSKVGADGDEDEEEEEEEDGDDDDEEEEVEDICPVGCDRNLYDRVLELRERRLDTEELMGDVQKAIDDLKKTTDRLKQREKQILKDAVQAELEVQQFQLQKQAALNQINVVVPLKLSQVYTFVGSGAFTGPTDGPLGDEGSVNGAEETSAAEEGAEGSAEGNQEVADILRDVHARSVVPDIDMFSHVLFSKRYLLRLQDRIGELRLEIQEERENLRELYKERLRLNKERDVRMEEIEIWDQKCKNIQMLKFGRILDLDAVEAGSDRSKEIEAEKTVKKVEEETRVKLYRLQKEVDGLEEKLAETTVRNTELLNTVANLTESRLIITRDLNSNKGPSVSEDSAIVAHREKEERKRMKMYLQLQQREILALKAELTMLKRKDVPPLPTMFSQSAPQYGMGDNNNMGQMGQMEMDGDGKLPPLPSAGQGGAAPMR